MEREFKTKPMKKQEHDFIGLGFFTVCRKCGRSLISLGVPQEPCKPKPKHSILNNK